MFPLLIICIIGALAWLWFSDDESQPAIVPGTRETRFRKAAIHEIYHILMAYLLPDATISDIKIYESKNLPDHFGGMCWPTVQSDLSWAKVYAAGYIGEDIFEPTNSDFSIFDKTSDYKKLMNHSQLAGFDLDEVCRQVRHILDTPRNQRRASALLDAITARSGDLSERQINTILSNT